MIIERLINDRKRYNIQNCEYETPIAFRAAGLWQLSKPVVYKWTWDLGRSAVMIPPDYRWSASVPKLARIKVDPELLFEASLLHDMGYETQGGERNYRVWLRDGTFVEGKLVNWYTGKSFNPSIPRSRWDALLFAFALASGVPPGMAEEAYVGVFIGGQDAWNSEEQPA